MSRQAKVETTFQKAKPMKKKEEHPNTGKAHNKMMKPDPLSEIAQFVSDNQDPETSKPSTLFLIRHFQEHECKHTSYSIIAKSGNYTGVLVIHTCNRCGTMKILGKKAEE